jgi:hypothetical protein
VFLLSIGKGFVQAPPSYRINRGAVSPKPELKRRIFAP